MLSGTGKIFYKYTSQNVDLGSINTSDTMAGVKLINAIMASMNEKTATYKEGDLQIDIKVGGYGSANFGSLTCKSLRKGKIPRLTLIQLLYAQLRRNAKMPLMTIWENFRIFPGMLTMHLQGPSERCFGKISRGPDEWIFAENRKEACRQF